jgi:hypothetical protein
MNELAVNTKLGLQAAWANVLFFVPKVLLFIILLIAGHFIGKILCRALNSVLERVGFDRLVERGGIKRALARTKWDASDILGKVLYYFVMLFALQLAFGVFGPNPVSDMLNRVVAYLPNIFVAGIIIIVGGAIAAAVKQIIQAALGGLSYGRVLAVGASVAIWTVAAFAALNQLGIAPAIVNGLFYAMLAIIAGSAIVAIGGGGISPMRAQWERFLGRVAQEAPKARLEVAGASQRIAEKKAQWKQEAEEALHQGQPDDGHEEKPRFKT